MIAVTVAPSFRSPRYLRQSGERGQVLTNDFAARGSASASGACHPEDRAGGERPRRCCSARAKDTHMRPFEERCADALAALEDDRSQSAINQMRGGGKADRAGADHRDGKLCQSGSPSYLRSFQ